MSPEDLFDDDELAREDEIIEEMAEDLAGITIDFCENHSVSLAEFNGLMLAQIVRTYRDHGLLDELKILIEHAMKAVAEMEQPEDR
jgi:hypothetical protein